LQGDVAADQREGDEAHGVEHQEDVLHVPPRTVMRLSSVSTILPSKMGA
jgi:hypothetical protein